MRHKCGKYLFVGSVIDLVLQLNSLHEVCQANKAKMSPVNRRSTLVPEPLEPG